MENCRLQVLQETFISDFYSSEWDPATEKPRGSAKYKTFLGLHITIQCVPRESAFKKFTIIKILFGMWGGKLSTASTPRNLYFIFYNSEWYLATGFHPFLDCWKWKDVLCNFAVWCNKNIGWASNSKQKFAGLLPKRLRIVDRVNLSSW